MIQKQTNQLSIDMDNFSSRFNLRAYTKKEFAVMYEVDIKTFSRWLRPHQDKIGEKRGWYYNVNQVKTIVSILGIPGTVDI